MNDISVRNSTIYLGSTPFAEIRYLPDRQSPSIFRGLSIYYYRSKKEAWIFPKHGWDIQGGGLIKSKSGNTALSAIKEQWEGNILGSKNIQITLVCSDVRISSDGREISYLTYGIFSKSRNVYQVDFSDLFK